MTTKRKIVLVHPESHERLRVIAALGRRTLQAEVDRLIDEEFERHGLAAAADSGNGRGRARPVTPSIGVPGKPVTPSSGIPGKGDKAKALAG